MKKLAIIATFICCSISSYSQVYNTQANPNEQLNQAIQEATKSGKHIWLEIGANWCKWCLEFDRFSHADAEIDSISKADFIVVKINYDAKNAQCKAFMKKLSYPQRFGFPVFVILDAQGNRLHTQNSAYLESGLGVAYDKKKVIDFLQHWNPASINDNNYQ
jgi:thiol:disulfide interchange protein